MMGMKKTTNNHLSSPLKNAKDRELIMMRGEEKVTLFEPLSTLKRKQSRQVILPSIPSSPTRKHIDTRDDLFRTTPDCIDDEDISSSSGVGCSNSTLGYFTVNKRRLGIEENLSPIPNLNKHLIAEDEDMVLQETTSSRLTPKLFSMREKQSSALSPSHTSEANKKSGDENSKQQNMNLTIVKPSGSSGTVKKAPSSPVRAYIHSKSFDKQPKSEKPRTPPKKESPKKQKTSFELAPQIYLNSIIKNPSSPKKTQSMPRLNLGTIKHRLNLCVHNERVGKVPNPQMVTNGSSGNLDRIEFSNVQLLSLLPCRVIQIMIEFYGGSFSKTCCFEGTLNYSKFIKTYYGKFKEDKTPRFIFKNLYIESMNMSFNEICHLTRIQSQHRNQMSIEFPISNYLISFPKRSTVQFTDENEIEQSMLRKFEFFASDKSLCIKITDVNIEGIETFESLIGLVVRTFVNMERFCFGRSVMRTKDQNSRSYYLDENFAKMFRETNHALKHLEYCGPTTFITSEFVSFTPKLETLKIESRNFINDIGNCVGNWRNLKVLDCTLDRSHFGYEKKANGLDFFAALNTIHSLHTLKLEAYTIFDEEFVGLKNNQSIRVLNISRATVGGDLLNIISTFSNLQALYANSIYGNSVISLAKLPNLQKLQILDLRQNYSLGDSGCSIIRNIKSLKKLFLMNLGEDQIHDKGLLELSSLPNLEELDVRFCDITNKGIISLSKSCSKLQIIHVGGCSKVEHSSLPIDLRLKIRK